MKDQALWRCPFAPPLEPRLQQRFKRLVQEHLQVSQSVASGLSALPGATGGFASVQAAWRFYQNAATTLPVLVQPLLEQGRAALRECCTEYGLVVHDQSHLTYERHERKRDRIGSKHNRDRGYDLQTALLVSDQAGQPLGPLYQNLVCAEGMHTTRSAAVLPVQTHLDELTPRLEYLEGLRLGRPLVHIIDAEADSAGHLRQWSGKRWLVRGKGRNRVQWEGQSCALSEVARQLHQSRQLVFCRWVKMGDQEAQQYVAETRVVVTRRTRQKRRGSKPRSVAGQPVSLRLIVSEVRVENGRVLALWLLLTNVSERVGAATVALWYYWRWRIESFFKLLKSAGHQLEHWQQESGLAVAKRLLVVDMACTLVWQLARTPGPQAEELRHVLVRLSGRQMKWGVAWTVPALLKGLWAFLGMMELLEHYPLSKLRHLAKPFLNPSKTEGKHV